eukprot:jgi/Hompol1/4916/HPOL_001861-RA
MSSSAQQTNGPDGNKDDSPSKTKPEPEPIPPLKLLGRILRLARPEYAMLLFAIVLLFISSAVSMAVPFSMGTIIDLIVSELGISSEETKKLSSTLAKAPLIPDEWRKELTLPMVFTALAGIFLVGAVANMGRVVLMLTAAERIIARLKNQVFEVVIKQDVSFHDANRSGELISRLSSDTTVVGRTLTQNVSDGLRNLATAVAGVSAMLYVNIDLTLTMMTIVPPVAVGAIVFGRYVRKLGKRITDANAEVTKLSEERLSGVRTVRAFSQESQEITSFGKRVADLYKLGLKDAYASGLFFGTMGFAGNIVTLAILYHGGVMVQNNLISVGELTSFFLYTVYVGMSIIGLTSWYADLSKGLGASSRLFQLLETKPVVEAPGGRQLERVRGKIELRNVNFSYPTRNELTIFNNLSFTVNPGETVAIVGHSGSGKSTIAQLVLRFYDPNDGTVLLDDVDLRELDPHWVRDRVIGLVPQEPILFATSVKENIRYGMPDATDEQIIAAAKQANAHDFIIGFTDGYDTFVGQNGLALSGGQKQRIAIARALIKNPQVLIMDEATSALDAASEHLVQEALDRLIHGRTVITIAHRLSTIQKADRIVMISEGEVVENDTFAALVAKPDGHFKELISKQLKN